VNDSNLLNPIGHRLQDTADYWSIFFACV